MARIKLNELAISLVGGIGGQTIKRVPNGFAIMNKSAGGSRSKLLLNSKLNSLSTVFQRWQYLDPADRQTWMDASLLFQFPDKFGDMVYLSPRSLFTKLNSQLTIVNSINNSATGITNFLPELFVQSLFFYTNPLRLELRVGFSPPQHWLLVQVSLSQKTQLSPVYNRREFVYISKVSGFVVADILPDVIAKFGYIDNSWNVRAYVTLMNDFGFRSATQFVDSSL